MVSTEKSMVRVWAAVLLLMIVFFVIRAAYAGFDHVLFGDNDDAMRMVVVRDFIAGQNWFDHTQYRMNTPYVADMHWSRLVDLPIAALVLLARPFAGASAEVVAGYVWPTMLLAVFIWLSGKLTMRLVGREGLLPGMLITAFSVITYGEFDFGRVDHHSVQIILTQLVVIFSIDALQKHRAALWAGFTTATALAIGTEALPVVVGAILVYGVIYIAAPSRHAAVRWFGLAFGLGTIGHLLLALPPSLWFSPACDAISIVYATAAFASGLGLICLTLLPLNERPWPLRLLAGVVAGSMALALVVVLFPNCLGGPYASVDPWLAEHWLARIGEAMPLPMALLSQPIYVISATVPALLAMLAVVHAVMRSSGTKRAAWLVLAAMLAVILAVTLVQVRGIRISAALIAPASAYWVVLARTRYLSRVSADRVLVLLGSWLGFAGILWAALVYIIVMSSAGARIVRTDPDECRAPGAYSQLAAMAPDHFMTPLELGAYVLLYTDHAIVSAPYHRNNQGLLDTYAFFNGPIEGARDILDARGLKFVVTCYPLNEMRGIPEMASDLFIRLSEQGKLPGWLEPISDKDSLLTIYAVKPR